MEIDPSQVPLVEILLSFYESSVAPLPMPVQIMFLFSIFHFTFTFLYTPLKANLPLLFEFAFHRIPLIDVPMTEMEAKDDGLPSSSSKSITLDQVSIKDPSDPSHIQCFDPASLQHLGKIPAMTPSDVDDLCAKASKAQKSWSQTTYTQRRTVLRTIQKYILAHQEDICRVCARDSGKPKVDALLGEVMTTCEKIRCINVHGEQWLQPQPRPVGPMMVHKSAYVEYVPYGVLGVIAPWNYPFHNMLNHVISGLFSGNAVVSKVSEHTAWSSSYFTRIVRQALVEHGHNPDIVQTLTGFGECGAALVDCKFVDKIIFTGSPNVGRLVMKGASKSLKPVILELGGKDPMVFCDDVNIDVSILYHLLSCFPFEIIGICKSTLLMTSCSLINTQIQIWTTLLFHNIHHLGCHPMGNARMFPKLWPKLLWR